MGRRPILIAYVTIEEGSARQFPAERPNWPKGQPWGHQLVEAHINNLLQWFAKGIVGQLKVDPVSTRIYDKDSALWLEKEEILKQKIFALEEDIKVSRSEAVSLATLFKESLNSLASAKNKIEKIDSINESLRTNNAKLSLSLKSESERTVDLHSNVDLLSAGQDVLRWRLKLKGFFVYILATVILGTLLMPLFFPDISRDLLNSWYGGMLKLRSIFE
ncbi:hypothetical protein amad1_16175 [Alteromonas mediterranea DE1]|nr:hypothetical protein amad1_16175 [Alteromonas mediterranea DE1]AGP98733.1 hypothetical protein I635_16130 [Alteromonas mediterranea UM7]AGQ02933.1 hypothetical protein I636_15485 [Alteromonas mediterranea UM4b]AMJ83826.1 hypothetical protein AV941_15990 [Alteromonas mediterranea]